MPLRRAKRLVTESRLQLLLIGLLLLAALTIAGMTLYALKGQQAQVALAIQESQQQAIALLASRVEQSLLSAIQAPLLALQDVPINDVVDERVDALRESFSALEQIVFLDRNLTITRSAPTSAKRADRRIASWISQRVRQAPANGQPQLLVVNSFVEVVDGRQSLFAYEAIGSSSAKTPSISPLASWGGWLVIRFDLERLEADPLATLFGEFTREQGGSISLRGATFEASREALTSPVTNVIPGWKLVYEPSPEMTNLRLREQRWAIVGVATAALFAITITGFAVWRELRREHALVELRNRFVANVSHELKTPLALIRMYAETLCLHRFQDSRREQEYLRVILREAERLSRMIGDVLNFERLRSGVGVYEVRQTDLADTVTEALTRYKSQLEEQGVHLEVNLATPLPPVPHNKDGVTEIIVNLLDNAAKYAVTGGAVQVQLLCNNDQVELQVIDFGPGIAPEDRNRLRMAFERGIATGAARGSGLGLALVEQIAARHRARFVLDAPEGHSGVRAVIAFPIAQVHMA